MNYRNPDIDNLFSDENLIQKYLDIEIALAQVQAELGIIPKKAAITIARNATILNIDLNRYRRDFNRIGFPILGLLKQLNDTIPERQGEYLHWGATTQDIMDTGLVLTLRDAIRFFKVKLDSLVLQLHKLSEEHQSSLMIGRSQLQQAIPMTFGFKASCWLMPLVRHKKRLEQIEKTVLQLQFGGAIGTLVSLGEIGFEVRQKLADKLDLECPVLSWHSQRDNILELMCFFGVLTGSLSKIAQDILLMTQSEVGELYEINGGQSSTMPNKKNPIHLQNVLIAGKFARQSLHGLMEAMVQDHERGTATWQIEWSSIPDMTSRSYYALDNLFKLIESFLHVDTQRMLTNAQLSDTVYAEALMMSLAPQIGRQKAHDLIEEAVLKTQGQISLKTIISSNQEFTNLLTKEELEVIFSGRAHIEMAGMWVTRVFKHLNKKTENQ